MNWGKCETETKIKRVKCQWGRGRGVGELWVNLYWIQFRHETCEDLYEKCHQRRTEESVEECLLNHFLFHSIHPASFTSICFISSSTFLIPRSRFLVLFDSKEFFAFLMTRRERSRKWYWRSFFFRRRGKSFVKSLWPKRIKPTFLNLMEKIWHVKVF